MNDTLIVTLVVLIYFSPVFYQLGIVIKENRKGNKTSLKKLKTFIKYSLVIVIPLTISFSILSHVNFLDYEKPMTFDKYEKITFNDFRGLEFFKKSLYGNERFAYVVTSIDSNIETNSVTIQSLFHPSKSFVYKKNNNSAELLNHEKFHIKITELFVRKAKKEISELARFDKDKIEQIIKKTIKQEQSFQKEYDYDTFHSYVLHEQKKYENKIDSLLQLLTDYKEPKIKF